VKSSRENSVRKPLRIYDSIHVRYGHGTIDIREQHAFLISSKYVRDAIAQKISSLKYLMVATGIDFVTSTT
jgi:hypothetical protein